MRRNLWLRIGLVVAVIAVCAWLLYPPKKTINLGLDLQGGLHLVLGVDVDHAIGSQVSRTGDTIKADLEKKGIGVSKIERRGVSELEIQLVSPQQWKDAQTVWTDMGTFDVKDSDPATGRVVLALKAREIRQLRELAVRQVLETIRNRIDQFGVAEPSIQQQGTTGSSSSSRASTTPSAPRLSSARRRCSSSSSSTTRSIPKRWRREPCRAAGDELLYQRRVDKDTKQERKIPYVVQKKVFLTGSDLTTARVSIDQNTSEPYVSVEFNAAGAKAFGDLTEANVGRRLAIVLDGNVHSAPQIRERIPSGRAQITGGFTTADATDLAIVLRAGALPAPVQFLEERTVGPSLGADSIRKGLISTAAAALAVVLFMVAYYRLSGLIADVALCPQPADSHGGHGRVSRHADAARHRGDRVDHRHGGGHQYPDLRADPRGAALGQDGARRDRRRLRPRLPDRRRHPRHRARVGGDPVPVRDGAREEASPCHSPSASWPACSPPSFSPGSSSTSST